MIDDGFVTFLFMSHLDSPQELLSLIIRKVCFVKCNLRTSSPLILLGFVILAGNVQGDRQNNRKKDDSDFGGYL